VPISALCGEGLERMMSELDVALFGVRAPGLAQQLAQ
jgi:hypothetical protein